VSGPPGAATRPGDEAPHPAGPHPRWAETWEVAFAGPDLGGFVRLTVHPAGPAWWWTYLLVDGRLVAVRDHDVPAPRVGLEVRGDGLWGEMVCETPLEHWSLAMEAFGVGFDDPADALGDERGQRLPVGFDLEWETGEPARSGPLPAPAPLPAPGSPEGSAGAPGAGAASRGGGYLQFGPVTGELLVGTGRLPVDAPGWRLHRWGPSDWWSSPWQWVGVPASEPGAGVSWGSSEPPETDPGRLPREARWVLPAGPAEASVLGLAPVPLAGPAGRRAELVRALCRFGDGAVGWAEWLRHG
jgi:hypothetical protein